MTQQINVTSAMRPRFKRFVLRKLLRRHRAIPRNRKRVDSFELNEGLAITAAFLPSPLNGKLRRGVVASAATVKHSDAQSIIPRERRRRVPMTRSVVFPQPLSRRAVRIFFRSPRCSHFRRVALAAVFSGLHSFYPADALAANDEGFLAGFVIGFLGTALPRLLRAPPLRRGELWTLLVLYLLTPAAHRQQTRAGDARSWRDAVLRRVHGGASAPPRRAAAVGFVLVALGYLSGLAGRCVAVRRARLGVGSVAIFGAMLLKQAFVLFPLLGIGTFLLPRFLRLREVRTMAEERSASAGWWLRAALSCVTGLARFGSFWLEPAPGGRAHWVRVSPRCLSGRDGPFHRQSLPPHTASLAANWRCLRSSPG